MKKIKKIHFIGIGGIGMSSLAEYLSKKYKISGSDLNINNKIKYLEKIGIKIFNHHTKKNINDQDLIIYTSAINKNNEELVEAKRKKIKVINRGKALGEFTKEKNNISIAGTHGKSSTTSFISQILLEAGKKFTAFLGARDLKIKSNFKYSKSNINVMEVDESDNSFNYINSYLSIVTNIDNDHMEFYKNKQNLLKAFDIFISKTKSNVILNADCKNIKKHFRNLKKGVYFSNINKNYDYYFNLSNGKYELYFKNKLIIKSKSKLLGKFNFYNLTAAIIACINLGVSVRKIQNNINKIKPPERRFEYILKNKKIEIIDDYAHHPNAIKEIRNLLNNIKDEKKNYLIFQPHRFSRFKKHYKAFVKEISEWENVILVDVYSAFEKNKINQNLENFIRDVKKLSNINIIYEPDFHNVVEKMLNLISNKNKFYRIITMGAGNIRKISLELKKSLNF